MKKGIIITLIVVLALGIGCTAIYLTYRFVKNVSGKVSNEINSIDKNVIHEIENEISNEINNELDDKLSDDNQDTSTPVGEDESENDENKVISISEEEAKSIGDSLYTKALSYYWGGVETNGNSIQDGIYMEISNISDVKDIFSTQGFEQYLSANDFVSEIDGIYYRVAADRGGDISYLGREDLKVENITDEKVVFKAVEKYAENEGEWGLPENQVSNIRKITNRFVIVKEDGIWKVEDFTMPN